MLHHATILLPNIIRESLWPFALKLAVDVHNEATPTYHLTRFLVALKAPGDASRIFTTLAALFGSQSLPSEWKHDP